jgi:hypothetical protein
MTGIMMSAVRLHALLVSDLENFRCLIFVAQSVLLFQSVVELSL